MRKSLIAVLAAGCVAAGAVWAAESLADSPAVKVAGPFTEEQMRGLPGTLPPPVVSADDAVNYRKPILNAAGTRTVGPGEQRITIPVDGVVYEVITTKPGMGRILPVER